MSESFLRWVIIVATVVTAAVHMVLGISGILNADAFFGIVFPLNGLGYLALLAALFLNVPLLAERRNLIRYAMIAYTALTFVLYFVFNGFTFGPAAIVAKLAELILIVALLAHPPARSRTA